MLSFLYKYKLTLLACIGVAVVSLGSFSVEEINAVPNYDKVLHGFMYYGLSLAVFCEVRNQWIYTLKHILLFAFVFAAVYGGIMEICQLLFTENRQADIFDWLANMTGSALFCVITYLILRGKCM